jgi:hypothetical protein
VTEEPLVGSVIEHETIIFQVVGGANRRSRLKTEMTNGIHKTQQTKKTKANSEFIFFIIEGNKEYEFITSLNAKCQIANFEIYGIYIEPSNA